MLTRPERLAAAVCVLLLLAALCVGCASPRVPAELPHYPCERIKNGTTQYVACSADEWVHQEILKGKQ